MIYVACLVLLISGAAAAPASKKSSQTLENGMEMLAESDYSHLCYASWKEFDANRCWCHTGCALDCSLGGKPGTPGNDIHQDWCDAKVSSMASVSECEDYTRSLVLKCANEYTPEKFPGLGSLCSTAGYNTNRQLDWCDMVPPPVPTEPGCWILLPESCDKQTYKHDEYDWTAKRNEWQPDQPWVQYPATGGYAAWKTFCEDTRAPAYDSWCSRRPGSTKAVYVLPPPNPVLAPNPKKDGCMFLFPTGCYNHPEYTNGRFWEAKVNEWQPDQPWVATSTTAAQCASRLRAFKHWCSAADGKPATDIKASWNGH